MMNQEEHFLLTGKLILKHQCYSLVYVYSDACILVEGNISVNNTAAAVAAANN